LVNQDIAPVWLGEFGTPNDASALADAIPGSQGQWFSSLIAFLHAHPRIGWAYWALNGEDRSGLLDASYTANPPSPQKLAALQSIQLPGADQPDPTTAAQPARSSDAGLHLAALLALIAVAVVVFLALRPRRRHSDTSDKGPSSTPPAAE
jgi:endoglucanase